MNLAINLESSTLSEKMQAMEQLWASITQKSVNDVTPNWHFDVLENRLQSAQNHESEFIDWKLAKEQLRAKVK